MSSTNYRSSAATMSSGGAPMTSANFQTNCTVGQPTPILAPGMDPYSDNFGLLLGFWYTDAVPASHCSGDANGDRYVDGQDLVDDLVDTSGVGLTAFADSYVQRVGEPNRRLFKRWRDFAGTGIHIGLNSDWPFFIDGKI